MNTTQIPWNVTTTNGNMDVQLSHTWNIPFAAKLVAILVLSINLLLGSSSNCILIIIINNSPTLKTPANSHLINICANNLILCLSMLLSLISILLPTNYKTNTTILTGFHIFLTFNCFLQYWGTFASISYYRSKIVNSPSLVVKRRRQIISRCLVMSWVTSVLVSLMVCLAHIEYDVYACRSINPFQNTFMYCQGNNKMSSQQLGIIMISLIIFIAMFVIICTSYQKVFKALNKTNTFGRNRVFPLSTRSASLPSEGERSNCSPQDDGSKMVHSSHRERVVYTISRNSGTDEFIVHYTRNDSINMLSFEDILALENPILASQLRKQIVQKRNVYLTRSNASNTSVKSKCPDFTDISASADLQRFQNLKNNSALRNHFIRRDRMGFNSATRNSLVMLASFVVCSLPMFVCEIPTVLTSQSESHRVLILMFTELVFCLNAPIYPLWYLVQNKRVRKCLLRVMDTICMSLRIRR
ncbi:uncharacterized protein LOC127867396 [Dreissena polymorpha]|uniref:G-protein coupled receptors family 1 profile domain-containing protein n=1 Tax=Dreissena polymorpha TaxID=45954 RepID=A0A9D4NB06_DREPO|nr:uncharacterized protein LOC127867396 [Dreissena polymorpha]KAH3891085.1 hypothetical protein DPMN_015174 [Dreissena polymorpha]